MTPVLLPTHRISLARIQQYIQTSDAILFPIEHSRFVWREIRPCVFNHDEATGVACRMIACIYDFLGQHKRLCHIRKDQQNTQATTLAEEEPPSALPFFKRELPLRRHRRGKKWRALMKNSTIVILPPTATKLEYTWEERLIHLEHDLIQKQSIAGLYSTLGGGYFMTRRLSTANALAREQQRIALLLGNKEMYYKCTINQAYNEIYAGRFQLAKMHIWQVWIALAQEKHFDEKLVLQNMCQSAMLFRKRVRQARRVVGQHDGDNRVVDDFSRIRVVQDQSTHHDLKVSPLLGRIKV